jgi:pilus assembly protein CpaE
MPNNGEERRGTLRILLVGVSAESRHSLRVTLESLGDPPLEIDEAERLDASAPTDPAAHDVTMLLFEGNNEDATLDSLARQAEQTPRPTLFALAPERSTALMRRILRAGADELLFTPLDPSEATRALLKISEARRRAERQTGGVIVSLFSTVGGVGVSSLACNLALGFRYTLNKRVAVVDLDLQGAAMAGLLNLEPEHTISDLAESNRRIDSILLESTLIKHHSGVYLLSAPKRLEDSELISDQTVGAVLDLMRQLFDFVVVDCGRHVDENAVAVWERSDFLFYMVGQSVAATRSAWRFIDLFGRLGLPNLEPSFLLGRYQAHQMITAEQISQTLGQPIFARIPRDEKLLELTQVRAQDLWQLGHSSTLTRAVEDLCRRLNGGASEAEAARGIMQRLLSPFRRSSAHSPERGNLSHADG